MSKPTVRRKDIELREDVEFTHSLVTSVREGVTTQWTATLNGHLSTGEYVDMYRFGDSANEALANLKSTVEAQGWRIAGD